MIPNMFGFLLAGLIILIGPAIYAFVRRRLARRRYDRYQERQKDTREREEGTISSLFAKESGSPRTGGPRTGDPRTGGSRTGSPRSVVANRDGPLTGLQNPDAPRTGRQTGVRPGSRRFDPMTGIYPTAQELLDRPAAVERTVESLPETSPRRPPPPPSLSRIRRMPPFKQAIVWSEILGPPKALREERE